MPATRKFRKTQKKGRTYKSKGGDVSPNTKKDLKELHKAKIILDVLERRHNPESDTKYNKTSTYGTFFAGRVSDITVASMIGNAKRTIREANADQANETKKELAITYMNIADILTQSSKPHRSIWRSEPLDSMGADPRVQGLDERLINFLLESLPRDDMLNKHAFIHEDILRRRYWEERRARERERRELEGERREKGSRSRSRSRERDQDHK